MRNIFLVSLLAPAMLLPSQGRAGGIPVFDGAGLAQEIMGYVQNLMDYAEQLNQLNVMDNQYVIQVQQYERELEEYQHFLNQIQRLGPVLDDAEWDKVLQQTVTYYGDSPWASIPNMKIVTNQGATNLKTVVGTAYEVPDSLADTISQWQARIPGYEMPGQEQAKHSKDYAQMQKFIDRQLVVAANQQGMDDRAVMIEKFERTAYGLGDDSDLQAQHLVTQQLTFLLQQQELILAQLNQLIASQETISEFAATQSLKARRLSKQSAERHKNNYLPASLGTDIWKRF